MITLTNFIKNGGKLADLNLDSLSTTFPDKNRGRRIISVVDAEYRIGNVWLVKFEHVDSLVDSENFGGDYISIKQ